MTKTYNTKKRVFASDAINMEDISFEYLNIINVPCGGGKTTWALKELPKYATKKNKILYLIDRRTAKGQIIKHNPEEIKVYEPIDKEILEDKLIDFTATKEKIILMTYHRFGIISKKYPNFVKNFEYVVCDEFDQIYKFMDMENGKTLKECPTISPQDFAYVIKVAKPCYEAYKTIHNVITSNWINVQCYKSETCNSMVSKDWLYETPTTIIALTATPEKILADNKFDNYIKEVELFAKISGYLSANEVEYSDLIKLIRSLDVNKKYLCYIDRITDILKAQEVARETGFNPAAIWSTTNEKHPMTEEQLEIRRSIIEDELIPDKINFFFINNANMTGINIRNEDFNDVIVNSTDETVRAQAPGRVRHDRDTTYYLSKNAEDTFDFPSQYLGIPLTKELKTELCEILRIKMKCDNKKIAGWTTVKKELIEKGFKVEDKRKRIDGKSVSVSIITR